MVVLTGAGQWCFLPAGFLQNRITHVYHDFGHNRNSHFHFYLGNLLDWAGYFQGTGDADTFSGNTKYGCGATFKAASLFCSLCSLLCTNDGYGVVDAVLYLCRDVKWISKGVAACISI